MSRQFKPNQSIENSHRMSGDNQHADDKQLSKGHNEASSSQPEPAINSQNNSNYFVDNCWNEKRGSELFRGNNVQNHSGYQNTESQESTSYNRQSTDRELAMYEQPRYYYPNDNYRRSYATPPPPPFCVPHRTSPAYIAGNNETIQYAQGYGYDAPVDQPTHPLQHLPSTPAFYGPQYPYNHNAGYPQYQQIPVYQNYQPPDNQVYPYMPPQQTIYYSYPPNVVYQAPNTTHNYPTVNQNGSYSTYPPVYNYVQPPYYQVVPNNGGVAYAPPDTTQEHNTKTNSSTVDQKSSEVSNEEGENPTENFTEASKDGPPQNDPALANITEKLQNISVQDSSHNRVDPQLNMHPKFHPKFYKNNYESPKPLFHTNFTGNNRKNASYDDKNNNRLLRSDDKTKYDGRVPFDHPNGRFRPEIPKPNMGYRKRYPGYKPTGPET